VARGYFTEEFVKHTHQYLTNVLRNSGIFLDGIYYCPHHVDGRIPYNIICDCRKPAPGMIVQAVLEHRIDCQSSFLIGDKVSDIELALNSGTKGLFVTTGKGQVEAEKVKTRYPLTPVYNSFSDAVDHILKTDNEN
jgi:D,D-heptose 1,7-bisphosphate phosphatase